VAGSPERWLGPGWVWLGQISATWPPVTCLLPANPSLRQRAGRQAAASYLPALHLRWRYF